MNILRQALGRCLLAVAVASGGVTAAADVRIVRDIPYDASIGKYGLGDLFLPAQVNGDTPLVLTIHGGGWAAGNRASWEGVSRFFSEQLGFAAFNIEYRLASVSNRWPACGNDCVSAARFVLSDAFKKRFSLSHGKIWICGGSAGGHLSLWTLVNLPVGDVAGCVSISAIGDPKPDFLVHRGRYNALFGAAFDESAFAAMNPVLKVRPGMAPLLCTHTERDVVVPIKSHLAFADAYRAAGNVCRTYVYPTDVIKGLTGHCIWVPGSGPYRRLIPQIESAIAAFVKNPYWVKADYRRNPYEGAPFGDGGVPGDMELVERVKFDSIPDDTNRFSSVGTCRIGELNGVKYLEAGDKASDRWAYRFILPDDAPLYALEVDYPDDRKRTMDIVVQGSQETRWDGKKGADYILQPGIACGDEYRTSGKMQTDRYIYWRRGADVTLSTMTARGGAPAAISEIRLYRIKSGKLPVAKMVEPPPNDDGWRRTFALYYEDVSVGYNFAVEGDGGDEHSIGPMIDRVAATMKFTGQNMMCYPGCWYDGLIGDRYLPRSHVRNYRERFYEAFDREGLGFMPLINQFWLKGVRLTPEEIERRYGDRVNMSPVAILDSGKPSDGKFGGRPAAWCILHHRVQSEIEQAVDTFIQEGAPHPSFKGVMLLLTRNSLLWFGNDTSGYNDYAVKAFMKDRGVALPFNETDPLRAKLHADWIRRNAYDEWIDWRCEKVAAFYRRLAAKLAAARPDLKLVVNSFLLPDCRHGDFGKAGFLVDANRRAGLDACKLADVRNISVCQTQMPADYRWFSSKDPSDPSRGHWGKDWIRAEPADRTLYSCKGDFGSTDWTAYPWINQHDRYWESHCGAYPTNCCHGLYDRDQTKPKLTRPWLRECPWRVSTINPSGRDALRHYAVPLRYRDVLAVSKGGFLIGTYGTEDVLVPWIRAFRALPAVKMEECAREGDVVARTCTFQGRRYFYAINTSDETASIACGFPPGTKDALTGKPVTDARLNLAAFELRSFVAEEGAVVEPQPVKSAGEITARDDSGAGSLWGDFAAPPDSARPWCYWWWINGHVDRETITADLEAMKRLGFGGILLFDSRGYFDDADHVVNPKAEIVWGSPAWHDLVEFAIRECARLGLEYTMNASASGGTLNGFIGGKEYETDILNRDEVVAHLDRAVGPILKRVPDLVGTTFTHIYSPSYEGNVKTGGSWKTIKDTFYATMRAWAHGHGLKLYSESGGPWGWGAKSTKLDCDQLDMLAHNDFPQGEFWPSLEKCTHPDAGHANKSTTGRFFQRGIVLAARREGRRIASLESFTHMYRHYSPDPAQLKPLADIAFADGANRLVWHTFTCSPKKFGVPGAEYFAGTHINRNVTWHADAGAFVTYLARCQALLQRGEYVDDGEFANITTNYYGWGRFRKDPNALFTTTHRREGNVDFFFVAGEGKGEVTLNASCEGRTVELWDAVTGRACRSAAAVCDNGKTRVPLDLPVGGSCFVVFAPAGSCAPHDSGRAGRASLPVDASPLTNAWQVSFAYHGGIAAPPPAPVTMETLRDWTTCGAEDDAASTSLRYFSGTATYRTTFPGAPHSPSARLSLGALPTGLAHVFVNGVDCGVVWCAPWEVDVSAALREGENQLEIRYTNNWYNRLVGDCFLKPEARVTRSTLRYWRHSRANAGDKDPSHRRTRYSGPSADDPLQPSGLLGPVLLRQEGAPQKKVD